MSIFALILLTIIFLILVYGILLYNNLVSIKHNVSKAWSNIDVLLKQRHDELPKLVDACKQYMQFERETLERVMQARAQVSDARAKQDIGALGAAESMLRGGLGQLFAVAEAYPELKTNESFQQLLGRISGLENAIADRREFYNESVNVNNVRIEQFPDLIVARMFTFGPFDLLEFQTSEKQDVNLKELFK